MLWFFMYFLTYICKCLLLYSSVIHIQKKDNLTKIKETTNYEKKPSKTRDASSQLSQILES